MDRFDEMRARVVKGSSNGGSVTSNGFLPLPVTQLSFTQDLTTRGKGSVKMLVPKECMVDVLIKKGSLPTSANDYNQKITLEEGSNVGEILFEKDPETGYYSSKYGIWAISRNDNGIQTALNNTNMGLYDFRFSKNLNITSGSVNSSNSTSLFGPLIKYEDTDSIFLDNWWVSGKGYITGIARIDKNTNTIMQVTAESYAFGNYIPITNDKVLISSGERSFFYTKSTNSTTTVNQDFAAIDSYMNLENKDLILVYSGSSSKNTRVLNGNTNSVVTNIYTAKPYRTSLGIFLCNTNYTHNGKAVYILDETTGNITEVLHSGTWSAGATSHKVKLHEDKYGTIWFGADSYYSCWKYDGEYLVDVLGLAYSFYYSTIFALDDDEYYVANNTLMKFNGDEISKIATGLPCYYLKSVKVGKQNGKYYIIGQGFNSNNSAGNWYTFEFDGGNLTQISTSYSFTNVYEIGGKTFFTSTSNGVYEVVDGEFIKVCETHLIDIKEFYGSLYGIGNGNKDVYMYKDNSFVQIVETSSNSDVRVSIHGLQDLIYIVNYYAGASNNAEIPIKTYNPSSEEVLITDKLVKYRLGIQDYVSQSSQKVYYLSDDSSEEISMPSINGAGFSNGKGVCFYATSSKLTVIYLG